MVTKNALAFFKRLIYALEKNYGFKLDLYRPTETVNTRTGRRITLRTKYKVRRAIVFPNSIFRDYNYASLIKALTPQNYDGLLDVTTRRIMISKKQLPKGFEIDTNDYIVFNHDRYEIKDMIEMELSDYWQLTIKQVKGQPTYEVQELYVSDELGLIEIINDIVISDAVPERLAMSL